MPFRLQYFWEPGRKNLGVETRTFAVLKRQKEKKANTKNPEIIIYALFGRIQ